MIVKRTEDDFRTIRITNEIDHVHKDEHIVDHATLVPLMSRYFHDGEAYVFNGGQTTPKGALAHSNSVRRCLWYLPKDTFALGAGHGWQHDFVVVQFHDHANEHGFYWHLKDVARVF